MTKNRKKLEAMLGKGGDYVPQSRSRQDMDADLYPQTEIDKALDAQDFPLEGVVLKGKKGGIIKKSKGFRDTFTEQYD